MVLTPELAWNYLSAIFSATSTFTHSLPFPLVNLIHWLGILISSVPAFPTLGTHNRLGPLALFPRTGVQAISSLASGLGVVSTL